MNSKNNNKTIFDIINRENEQLLAELYAQKAEKYISFSSARSKDRMITLKSMGTFRLLQNTLKQYLKLGKEFFKNARIDDKGKKVSGKYMSREDKEYFGYDLNKIDYEKISSLNIEELKFIIDNLLDTANTALHLIDDLTVNIGSIKFTEKVKKIRNMRLITHKILINTYLKHSIENDAKDIYDRKCQLVKERQLLDNDGFQAWMIDQLRNEGITIPNIDSIEPNKEMEVKITKQIFKKL